LSAVAWLQSPPRVPRSVVRKVDAAPTRETAPTVAATATITTRDAVPANVRTAPVVLTTLIASRESGSSGQEIDRSRSVLERNLGGADR
jgi:hypothetical protein